MKRIALGFKKVLENRNVPLHSDPIQQLFEAIKNVHSSWYSQRAQVYRKHLQIADEWGTAVIIQKMVLGNLHKTSGTGVVFTHDTNMANPGIRLNGDYSLLSQGEDVVGGTTTVLPISEHQTNGKTASLQTVLPRVYQRLYQLSDELINKLSFGHQEIEFTFESDNPYDLYILQVRDQDIFVPELQTVYVKQPPKASILGKGIGISNQILNGIIVFDFDDLQQQKKQNPEAKLIFVSADTTPDDIGIILECDGLITSRGGATSHAAVTAGRLGKTCILSCSNLQVFTTDKCCRFDDITLHTGDLVSIDATTGTIYAGHFKTGKSM
ncbi:MAG TPA: PEP/pyruvate-binding domain-containing protein, partial [Tenuifilaceae bacterium]|nr:PEP/pyruvate-binding domain-containing protein [Tenuifilaceae bacterium]